MSSEKDKLWWETQKNGNWKALTDPLSKNHKIHASLNNFIKTFYWRFRENKGYQWGFYNPEIDFQGFQEFFINEEGLLGHCKMEGGEITTQQTIVNGEVVKEEKIYSPNKMSISINQFYLLSKLGMDKLITSYSVTDNSRDVTYRNSSLDELISTIAHELAHAHQNTANLKKENGKKSQCESTGDRNSKGELLYPQLAAEHTRLTTEIQQMMVNSSEYQTFKNWWTSKQPLQEQEPYQEEENNYEEKEQLLDFFLLINNSEDLTDLEENYQIARNSAFYNNEKNDYESRKKIDNFYTNTKNYLTNQSSQLNKNNDRIKTIALFLVVIGGIVIIGLILFGQKKKKRY